MPSAQSSAYVCIHHGDARATCACRSYVGMWMKAIPKSRTRCRRRVTLLACIWTSTTHRTAPSAFASPRHGPLARSPGIRA
jgi:hypothetical protein